MDTVVRLLIAYLLGSISSGAFVPRLMGVDIYAHGSGNPGASNVMRTLGKKAGAVVMLVDASKGLLAALIGGAGGTELGFWCALAAVIGHVFPVWQRFRGGRGVATAIGASLFLAPWFGLVLAVAWGVTVALTKTASIASLGAMVLYVPGYALYGHRGWALVAAALTAALVVARHAANIRRLLGGREQTVDTQ
ncbi:MAG: glycerol-3-phosphate 1-O-acyltransferase PlsY [Acidimicrobiia bacterium]